MRRIALLVVLVTQALLVDEAQSGIEHPQCYGEPVIAGPRLAEFDDVIWNGNWLFLNANGWTDSRDGFPNGEGFVRRLSNGDVGQIGNALPDGYQVCWSATPFTFDETQGGEFCTSEGPLTFSGSTTYYRMNIDSTGTDPACEGQTCYCQVAMTTGADVGTAGDTAQIPYTWGTTALGYSSEYLWGHDCCESGVGGQQYVAIDPDTGVTIAWGVPQGNQQIHDIDFLDGQIYAVTGGGQQAGDDPGTLGTVNPRTGAYTVIGASPLITGARLTGLAVVSAAESYVSATNRSIYRVNLVTGATELVGSHGVLINDLAVDSSGNLYASCSVDQNAEIRSLCSVNTNTGAVSLINDGAFEPVASFAALAFDDSDTLWFVRTNSAGGGTVDPQTGVVTALWTPSGGSGSAPEIELNSDGGLSIPLIRAAICQDDSAQC